MKLGNKTGMPALIGQRLRKQQPKRSLRLLECYAVVVFFLVANPMSRCIKPMAVTTVSMIQVEKAAAWETKPASSRHMTETAAPLTFGEIRKMTAERVIIDRVDGFESQLGVNHYGHLLLQRLLLPLIEKSKGRIVVVGSEGYKMGLKTIKFDDMNWNKSYTANNAYSQSKLAQIMSVYELQDRLKKCGKTDVKVYACHPGASKTSLITTSGGLLMRSIWFMMTFSPLVQSAEKGCYPSLMCATEQDLDQTGFYGPTGRSNWVGPVGGCELEQHAVDKAVSRKLWEVSEQAIGMSFGS